MKKKLIKIDSSMALGKEIRRRRVNAGMTLGIAAPLCGVSVKFLQSLETGKPTAQIDKSIHVANMLGIVLYIEE